MLEPCHARELYHGQLKELISVTLSSYSHAVNNMYLFPCIRRHLVYVCGLITTVTERLHQTTTFQLESKFLVLVSIWDMERNTL